ncbi:protein of unknown function [Azospirillum lipoferum 4B]|uniref:Uncharacterized protein n=1 Tax=Azospirillum lipoferum (strain 4B) TaxID=862719 RepID=G7Z9D8_AZOL4|nr:protein of unknown function [Azospirillum lipoferum 4B]
MRAIIRGVNEDLLLVEGQLAGGALSRLNSLSPGGYGMHTSRICEKTRNLTLRTAPLSLRERG